MWFYDIENVGPLRQSFTSWTLSIFSGFAIWGILSAGQVYYGMLSGALVPQIIYV
jgi:hypothetical protein